MSDRRDDNTSEGLILTEVTRPLFTNLLVSVPSSFSKMSYKSWSNCGEREDSVLNVTSGFKKRQQSLRLLGSMTSVELYLKLALLIYIYIFFWWTHGQFCCVWSSSRFSVNGWSIQKPYPADFLVKLLLKTSQTLEGADVKPNTTGEDREERKRQRWSHYWVTLTWFIILSG